MIRVRYWGDTLGWAWAVSGRSGEPGTYLQYIFYKTAEAACAAAWRAFPDRAIIIKPRPVSYQRAE